jgi:mRNA interferase HicA
VTPDEFLRRVKRLARSRGVGIRLVAHRGKGGHQTLWLGDRRTVVAFHGSGHEVPKGTLHAMLRALNITLEELNEG